MSPHVEAGTRTMWQLTAPGRGNLALADGELPAPGAREIVVQVTAASLNARDNLLIDHGIGFDPGMSEPLVPGSDAAGVVVATGAEVTRFAEGDRVITTFIPGWIDGRGPGTAREPNGTILGGPLQGVLADHVVLSEEWAVRAPDTLSDAEASTLPCAGLTAWTALVERGRVRAGETVVVLGTGGVALFALQIAVAHGADVIVVSGDDARLARARALGARHGINRQREHWVEEVYRLTGDRGADHVVETVGGAHVARSLEAAAVCGRVWLIGLQEGLEISGSFVTLAVKRLSLEGIQVGHRRSLEELVAAVDVIGLKPVIEAEYGLADLPAALDHLARGAFGKIVVRMNDGS